MGGSTRWPFACQTADEAEKYFLDSIEQWRIAMGNLTNFYLIGHSFGGYLSGLYASMYHQHIRKLLCISPIGFDIEPENYSLTKVK